MPNDLRVDTVTGRTAPGRSPAGRSIETGLRMCGRVFPLLVLLMLPMAGSAIPPLPVAVSNNAVAAVEEGEEFRLYSFFGLGQGKTWRDVSRRAFEYDSRRNRWQELPPPPVAGGRLASVAAAARGRIYLFGGYTVAEDGTEVSTPDVLRFDPRSRRYTAMAPMPVPVDDTVALVYADRWVILVSGWHQHDNVAAVQVYDTRRNVWSRAPDWPGTPVFGHAGALLGEDLLICDGVRLDTGEGTRRFQASDECWHGRIQEGDPTRIAWQRVASHPGLPRYRMGSFADDEGRQLVFVAGSENPYNFDGTGYDGVPSPASARVDAFDLGTGTWRSRPLLEQPSMDHRGMPCVRGRCYLLGGMDVNREVTDAIREHARGGVE
ncbi:Kelch repeat-containing protein [Pseudoxanthomonas japonensis]|uniref:Kelch repeat-containing protein n=1 Tax=Pseudoxanthomonas japonensis TaxID=69284 RepID=UPI003747BB6C